MMKKIALTSLLPAIVAGTVILLTPKISLAQVNMSLLTEVAKSCQEDALSPVYYERMDINTSELSSGVKSDLLKQCIYARYFHSLILSKLPWLASTDEMLPEYPGSAGVSLISYNSPIYSPEVLDCIVSQDGSSQECRNSHVFKEAFLSHKISSIPVQPGVKALYIYICPSCVIVNNNILSTERMTSAFIKWFLTLDKPKRREIISILRDKQNQGGTLGNILRNEAWRAVEEYQEIRRRVEQQDRKQRERDILGN